VRVRRLEAHEVELHGELRLRALEDAPESDAGRVGGMWVDPGVAEARRGAAPL
jgi:hypothetical protein